jgi:hypothetical protein
MAPASMFSFPENLGSPTDVGSLQILLATTQEGLCRPVIVFMRDENWEERDRPSQDRLAMRDSLDGSACAAMGQRCGREDDRS